MIKEKDLGKTRFFTTNGTDIWKIKTVSTFTLAELVNCETGGTASARVGERSAGGFVPVIMPKVDVPAEAHKPKAKRAGKKKKVKGKAGKKIVPKTIKTKNAVSGKTGRGCRPGEKPSSQYLGVTVKKSKTGRVKYFAQISRGGKFTNLGSHNIEELAAAAIQEYLGNAEEATRLRMLAKQKTDEEIGQLKEDDKVTAWDCTKCGAGYDTKPQKCTHCGGHTFAKARPEKKDE